jgi:NADH-quinone oxidoreductase subunit C
MPIEAPITDIEQLRENPALAALLGWRREVIQGAKWDRNELSIYVERALLKEACATLRSAGYAFLSDITAVDLYPAEPRFEVIYQLLSHSRKEYLRLKVRLHGDDPIVESVLGLWPAANFFEREVFDLFGVRFTGRDDLVRIMLPEDWEGHPLRKDYPVEGYR